MIRASATLSAVALLVVDAGPLMVTRSVEGGDTASGVVPVTNEGEASSPCCHLPLFVVTALSLADSEQTDSVRRGLL